MKTIKNVMKKGLFALILAVAVLSIGMAVSAQTAQAKARNAPKGANKKEVEALSKMINETNAFEDMSNRNYYVWKGGRLVSADIEYKMSVKDTKKEVKRLKKKRMSLDFSVFPNLKNLTCGIAGLVKIDVSRNKHLETMWQFGENAIAFSKQNRKLKTLRMNAVEAYDHKLDVSKLSGLKYLEMNIAYGCSDLDLSKNKNLEDLIVPSDMNKIKVLKLPKTKKLKRIILNHMLFKEIDVSYYSQLTILHINCCPKLTRIKLPHSATLKDLSCSQNKLTGCLDVSGLTGLEFLGCSNNALTSLILPDTKTLRYLVCNSNKITDMDSIDPEKLRQKYPKMAKDPTSIKTDFIKPNETPAPAN